MEYLTYFCFAIIVLSAIAAGALFASYLIKGGK